MQPIEYFVKMYIKEFPDQENRIKEHIELNGMFLGHVFFDEEICGPLCHLLRRAKTTHDIQRLVKIIEAMLVEGDEYVKSVVTINVLKKMKAEKDIYHKAKELFSTELVELLEYNSNIG